MWDIFSEEGLLFHNEGEGRNNKRCVIHRLENSENKNKKERKESVFTTFLENSWHKKFVKSPRKYQYCF